jgi:hypothetical protein
LSGTSLVARATIAQRVAHVIVISRIMAPLP